MPYARGDGLARPWIKPGTPGLEHRIGGIEKQPGTGNIDYSPAAHQEMTDTRARQGARRRQFDPRPGSLPRPRRRRAGGGRLGLDLRPDPPGGAPRDRQRQGRRPRPHPPHLADAQKYVCPIEGLQTYPRARDEHGPAQDLLRDQFLVDAQSLTKVSRPPVPHRRDRGGDRCRLWADCATLARR